jgi:predicted RNase H-like HicB family nuclease/uncharacterized damage-inducible protein DinB
MTVYSLHLESGPKRKTTMVHVPGLLGCIARGPTTEAALEATPEAIRDYLRFLQRHGEAVDSKAVFSTEVAEHVTEGYWLGNGDPAPGFAPDFEALSAEELKTHLRRLGWLLDDLLVLIQDLTHEQLLAEPEKGRPIHRILRHVAESHASYLHNLVGKVDGLSAILRVAEDAPADAMPAVLSDLWQLSNARLQILTEDERMQLVPHGQVTWTARRCLRRMLEHAWEHLLEISARKAGT